MNRHLTTHIQIRENVQNILNILTNQNVDVNNTGIYVNLTNVQTIMNIINQQHTNTIQNIVILRNQYTLLNSIAINSNPGFMYEYIFTILEQINTLILDIFTHLNNTINNNQLDLNFLTDNVNRIQFEVNGLLSDLSDINQNNIFNTILNTQNLIINNLNN